MHFKNLTKNELGQSGAPVIGGAKLLLEPRPQREILREEESGLQAMARGG
jgi:hypothetical protein